MTDTIKDCPSYSVTIWIAGDAAMARECCRVYCNAVGLCVTVTNTDFIYTGGQESGVCVGLLNYPRFPREPSEIWGIAVNLALDLRRELHQESVLICDHQKAQWIASRKQP